MPSQVNAGPVETLSQVSAEAENFVQVWDGMESEAETDEEDSPSLALAQTEDDIAEIADSSLCADVQCKLGEVYTQVSSSVLNAFGSMK